MKNLNEQSEGEAIVPACIHTHTKVLSLSHGEINNVSLFPI